MKIPGGLYLKEIIDNYIQFVITERGITQIIYQYMVDKLLLNGTIKLKSDLMITFQMQSLEEANKRYTLLIVPSQYLVQYLYMVLRALQNTRNFKVYLSVY